MQLVNCSLFVQLKCKDFDLSTKTLSNNQIKFKFILHIAYNKLNIFQIICIYI